MTAEVAVGLEIAGTEGKPVLLLIHGFAGSSRTWDRIRPFLEPHFQIVLLDLPGHGTAVVQRISLVQLVEAIAEILTQGIPEPRLVGGYSMGGRIALQVALQWPESVDKLALIGASPGIEAADERAARRERDRELAARIRKHGVSWFEEYWSNLPLFATQEQLASDLQERLKQERLNNDAEGLALALENWGTGEQEWLLPRLSGLTCPTLLISGARDDKFCALSRRMSDAIPSSQRVEIPHSGHATQIEQPEATAQALISFFLTDL